MRVHVPDHPSRGIQRVATALRRYAPAGVTFVSPDEADLVVLHIHGRRDAVQRAVSRLRIGQRYAMVQYVLRSSQKPNTADWLAIWNDAQLVWSYYDLYAAIREDGHRLWQFMTYRAPLGVDGDVFYPRRGKTRKYLIAAMSQSWLTESLRECVSAALAVGGQALHFGGPVRPRPGLISPGAMSDRMLATYLSRCRFVSGLRRIEGFELPAAEGLLCGARPVLFDQPHYRHWYGDWAEYLPETDRDSVITALTDLFQRGARPVTDDERHAAAQRFHWPTIIGGFWERVL